VKEFLRKVLSRHLPPSLWSAVRETYRTLESERMRVARRERLGLSYYDMKVKNIKKWAAMHTEETNLYYDLTDLNRNHLAHMISAVTDKAVDRIGSIFNELDRDDELRAHFARGLKTLRWGKDIHIEYGRRLAWYAFVRLLKPKTVIETGVDLGVGSCLLCAALLRNAAEGAPGRYYGTEIRPEAGQLFGGNYAAVGEILVGDSIQSLERFTHPIDLVINDSDHSPNYEYSEYLIVRDKLSPTAIILGDNSDICDALLRFSCETGRKFLFFREEPRDHWFPGGGIGISYPAIRRP
jgi:hypothetical protein